MRRRTFDTLASVGGLVLAVVLLVGGGLLVWGHNVVSNELHSQLVAQKIFFPPKGNEALTSLPAADRAAMSQYAGQQMVNGAQAEVWADHFIAVHLKEIGGGKTYSQLSAAAMASPHNTALAQQVQTVFRGETLRGMLLNAYGFWQMGQIMLIAAIVAFAGAGLLLLLSGLGLWHARRTAPEKQLFAEAAPAKAEHALSD
jgi:hypothetical protein